MTSLKHFLWALPFTCFFGTYVILYYFFSPALLQTPLLIGKNLQETVQILSDYNLNLRIVSQKIDPDIQEGTILSQTPAAQRSIRPHQSVFVVVSKKPEQQKTPLFIQKKKAICDEIAHKNGISLKLHDVASNAPGGSCIGQLPNAEQPLITNRVTLYFSQGTTTKPVILPLLKKRSVQEVVQFLNEHAIKYTLIHAKAVEPSHRCTTCTVIDQKPLAGSLLDLTKPVTIQLYVQ